MSFEEGDVEVACHELTHALMYVPHSNYEGEYDKENLYAYIHGVEAENVSNIVREIQGKGPIEFTNHDGLEYQTELPPMTLKLEDQQKAEDILIIDYKRRNQGTKGQNYTFPGKGDKKGVKSTLFHFKEKMNQ